MKPLLALVGRGPSDSPRGKAFEDLAMYWLIQARLRSFEILRRLQGALVGSKNASPGELHQRFDEAIHSFEEKPPVPSLDDLRRLSASFGDHSPHAGTARWLITVFLERPDPHVPKPDLADLEAFLAEIEAHAAPEVFEMVCNIVVAVPAAYLTRAERAAWRALVERHRHQAEGEP